MIEEVGGEQLKFGGLTKMSSQKKSIIMGKKNEIVVTWGNLTPHSYETTRA